MESRLSQPKQIESGQFKASESNLVESRLSRSSEPKRIRLDAEADQIDWIQKEKKAHDLRINKKREELTSAREIAVRQRARETDAFTKQKKAAGTLTARTETWIESAKASEALLQSKCTALTTAFASYSEACPFSGKELGTLKQVNQSEEIWKVPAKQPLVQLEKTVIPRIAVYSKELEAAAKRLQAMIKEAVSDLEQHRSGIDELWESYVEVYEKYLNCLHSGSMVTADPLIAGRKYVLAVENLRVHERKFTEVMEGVFDEIEVLDRRRIDGLKDILEDYYTMEREILNLMLLVNEDTVKLLRGISGEKDVGDYLRGGDFNKNEGKESVFRNEQNVSEDNEVSIQAQETNELDGDLQRPGKFVRSNWYDTYVILASTGYFYQFESRKAIEPKLSFRVTSEAVVKLHDKPDLLAFSISVPDTSFFGSSDRPINYVFRTSGQEELVKWLTVLEKHVKNAPLPNSIQ